MQLARMNSRRLSFCLSLSLYIFVCYKSRRLNDLNLFTQISLDLAQIQNNLALTEFRTFSICK